MPDDSRSMVEIVVAEDSKEESLAPLRLPPPNVKNTAASLPCDGPIRVEGHERQVRAVRMGEALRRQGLDEQEIARKLAEMVERLAPKSDFESRSDKTYIDTLKECVRLLNDAPGAKESRGPVSIKLVHNVPRPRRQSKSKRKIRKEIEDDGKP